MSLCKWRTLAFYFLAVELCDSTIFGFGNRAEGNFRPEPITLTQTDQFQDLAELIRPVPENQSRIFSQALDLLSSLQAAPACHRLATASLLDSCQSIDGSMQDAEALLDDTRSTYAAQLAVCEIQSADLKVPSPCETLISNLKAGLLHKSGAQRRSRLSPGQCLQALETRPQWWTSYSNNRQNAVVICQAARVDIEKDELIKLHKTSVEASKGADAALAQSVEYSQIVLRRQHEEFTLVKQALQEQLLEQINAASGRAQSFFEKMMVGLDGGIHSFLTRITTATGKVESDVAALRKDIHAANAKTKDLEKNVAKVFQKAAEGTGELASIQTRRLDESNGLAMDLRQTLQQMREYDVHNLVVVVREMYGQMRNANDVVISMSARQDNFDNQMNRLSQLMTGLQDNAQALQDAQFQQETTQARLQDAMEAGLNASLAQISVIQKSAASLQAVFEDISQSVGQVTSLAWFVRRFWMWASLVALIILVLLAGFRLNAQSIKIAALTIGIIILIKLSTPLLWNLAHEPFALLTQSYHPWNGLLFLGFVTGIMIVFGLSYRHSSNPTSLKHLINASSSSSRKRKARRMWSV